MGTGTGCSAASWLLIGARIPADAPDDAAEAGRLCVIVWDR